MKTTHCAYPATARYSSAAGLNKTLATSNLTPLRESGRIPTRTSDEDELALLGTGTMEPAPPHPASAPASSTHTLSPSATAKTPLPRAQLSALRLSVPMTIAGRSSRRAAFSGLGLTSNEPALKPRRRCTRSGRVCPVTGSTVTSRSGIRSLGGAGKGASSKGGGSDSSATDDSIPRRAGSSWRSTARR